MSQQQGLKAVGILILAVSAVFGAFLVREAIDLFQGFSSWSVSDSYLHDAYLVCRGIWWLIGAGFAWKTVKTGLSFLDIWTSRLLRYALRNQVARFLRGRVR